MEDGMNVHDEMKMGIGKGFNDGIFPKGRIKLELFDEQGRMKDVREIENTVTTLGKYCCADQILASPSIAKPGWMELGTGSPGASTLGAYIAGSRTALDSKTRNNAVVTMICTFGAGVGTGAITEAGIFNVVTQNTTDLIVSASFSVINKAAGDSLVVTWTLTYA